MKCFLKCLLALGLAAGLCALLALLCQKNDPPAYITLYAPEDDDQF